MAKENKIEPGTPEVTQTNVTEAGAVAAPEAKAKKRKKIKVPWRQRLSLASMLLWTALFSITGAGLASGYYGYKILYENKLTDTWAIMFLELERQGNALGERLDTFANQSIIPATSPSARTLAAQPKVPDVILRVAADPTKLDRVRGDIPNTILLNDLNLRTPELRESLSVLQFAGEEYLAVKSTETVASPLANETLPAGTYFLLWKIDIGSWFISGARSLDGVTAYLVTKEGKMLFSNVPTVTQESYIKRPLVQKFIGAPLRMGQFDFQSDDGPAYGFFYEVPRTNVMMFMETPRQVALASVNETAIQYGIVLIVILAVAGLILQFPLTAMLGPLRELVNLAFEVGEGNFNIKPERKGFGEVNLLTQSFYEMGQSLAVREEKINMLLVEQKEKFRLADEVAIAQSIQENFLSKEPLPRGSGLEVATHYTPAAECAGDWYGYFADEANGQSVFVVADVSGHGAGSAMFTAIIAATFEEMRAQGEPVFPLEEFARKLNRLILKLGRGKWHATLLAARYAAETRTMEILNAGHPSPMLVYPAEMDKKAEPIGMGSDLLGVNLEFNPATQVVELPAHTSLLMYTDGLIEGRPDRKLYSERRLRKACQIQSHQSLSLLVENIFEDWHAHLEGQPALDDLCLLAVRAI